MRADSKLIKLNLQLLFFSTKIKIKSNIQRVLDVTLATKYPLYFTDNDEIIRAVKWIVFFEEFSAAQSSAAQSALSAAQSKIQRKAQVTINKPKNMNCNII